MKEFDIDSEQVAKIRSANWERLRPYDLYGRERISFGKVVADADQNDVLGVAKVPRDCRILPSVLSFTALGASVTASIGVAAQDGSGYIDNAGTVADSATFFATGVDVSAAGSADFAKTIAGKLGYIFEKDVIITVTLAGADPASGTVAVTAKYVND